MMAFFQQFGCTVRACDLMVDSVRVWRRRVSNQKKYTRTRGTAQHIKNASFFVPKKTRWAHFFSIRLCSLCGMHVYKWVCWSPERCSETQIYMYSLALYTVGKKYALLLLLLSFFSFIVVVVGLGFWFWCVTSSLIFFSNFSNANFYACRWLYFMGACMQIFSNCPKKKETKRNASKQASYTELIYIRHYFNAGAMHSIRWVCCTVLIHTERFDYDKCFRVVKNDNLCNASNIYWILNR